MQSESSTLTEMRINNRRNDRYGYFSEYTASKNPDCAGVCISHGFKMSPNIETESMNGNAEKALSPERLHGTKGYILDARLVPNHGLKTDKTGNIIL